MPDIVSPETRSRMMAGIRGKNTKPEMLLRRALHRDGYRYRLHDQTLPGRPDLVLPRHNAAILVHGCFWHGHVGCKYFKIPATRVEFWTDKIETNRVRDMRDREALERLGWRTAVIWECATRHEPQETVATIEAWLNSRNSRLDISWSSPQQGRA